VAHDLLVHGKIRALLDVLIETHVAHDLGILNGLWVPDGHGGVQHLVVQVLVQIRNNVERHREENQDEAGVVNATQDLHHNSAESKLSRMEVCDDLKLAN